MVYLFGNWVQCVTLRPAYAQDADGDNILDGSHNRPATPNGPLGGPAPKALSGRLLPEPFRVRDRRGVQHGAGRYAARVRGDSVRRCLRVWRGILTGDYDQDINLMPLHSPRIFGRSVLLNPCTTRHHLYGGL